MATFNVSLYEPIHPGWSADSIAVTADSDVYRADGSPLTPAIEGTDAGINAHIYDIDIVEPVARGWSADSAIITADSVTHTADGAPVIAATDSVDAEVIAAEVSVPGGGVRPFKPYPVTGYGYGILPQLWGEAFGTVGVTGTGSGEVEVDEEELIIALLMAFDEAA